jgi:hypothetical protein
MRITPFQASIATGLLTVGATWLGARINWTSQARREREAREAERRHVFERETLISLQDALETLYRLVEDLLVERFPPETDAHQAVPVALFEPMAYRTSRAEVQKLLHRVLDDDLAVRIQALVHAADDVATSETRHAADNSFDELSDLRADVNKRIGEPVRRLFGA